MFNNKLTYIDECIINWLLVVKTVTKMEFGNVIVHLINEPHEKRKRIIEWILYGNTSQVEVKKI